MTTSELKINANRQNALRSTGPNSPKGKNAASGNSITHGFFAHRVLPGEDPHKFQRLVDALYKVHEPRCPAEEHQLLRIAEAIRASDRLRSAENRCMRERVSAAAMRARARNSHSADKADDESRITEDDIDDALVEFVVEDERRQFFEDTDERWDRSFRRAVAALQQLRELRPRTTKPGK